MSEPLTPENPGIAGIGRNEPCPCGSGKKYKRCCGVAAAPKITPPKNPPASPGAMPGGIPGMENMSPEQIQQMQQMGAMLQRLPRGQMQRLQAIVQKAMSGKDVSREAEEFQKTLPVEFQSMLGAMAPSLAAMSGGQAPATASASPRPSGELTEEEARRIVAEAAAEGKVSAEEAEALLKGEGSADKSGKIGKLWRGLTGSKK